MRAKPPRWPWVIAAIIVLLIVVGALGDDTDRSATPPPATPPATTTATTTTTTPIRTINDARAAVDGGDYGQAIAIARAIDDTAVLQIRRRIANRVARRARLALRAGDRPRTQTLLRQAERYPTTALTRRVRAEYRAARARASRRAAARRAAAAQRRRDARRTAEQAAQPPPPPPPAAADCDPNYSGCVPPYPPDVDCPDIGGPVQVLGSDPHGLDRDSDGVGCE